MNQTSAIAAALIVGFIVYITVKPGNELAAYLSLLTSSAPVKTGT